MRQRTIIPSVLVLLLFAAGCDDGDAGPLQVRENAFTWSDQVPAGATLHVREFNGSIEVAPSEDDTLRVTARIEWRRGNPDEVIRFIGRREGQDALICAMWQQGDCSVGNYNAKLDGGTAARMQVHFDIRVPAGVKLDLVGISSDIAAAASAPVRARSVNGSVRVATSVGPVNAETMNGDVDIRMTSLVGGDSVIAKTLNGDALVYLPETVDAVIDLSVTNGSVTTEYPVLVTGEAARRSIRGTIGAGGRTVHARSLNGTVALRQLDAQGRSRSYGSDGRAALDRARTITLPGSARPASGRSP